MNIEFEGKGLKADYEKLDYVAQFIDVATKLEGISYKEMVETIEDKFDLTDSEWAVCFMMIGAHQTQKEEDYAQ